MESIGSDVESNLLIVEQDLETLAVVNIDRSNSLTSIDTKLLDNSTFIKEKNESISLENENVVSSFTIGGGRRYAFLIARITS